MVHLKVKQFVLHCQFLPGALVGKSEVRGVSPRGCSLLVDSKGRKGVNGAGGTKGGVRARFAGHTQGGAETGGGVGRGRGEVLPEG